MLSHPASPPLYRDEIAARIPHAGTMCLLDTATEWNADSIRCETNSHRRNLHPLASAGRLGIANAIEYAAQAMALHGSLTAPAGARPRAGFLASVRGVEFFADRLDDIAESLQVSAERLSGDGNSVLYAFRVAAGDRPLATGRAAVILDASTHLTPGETP